MENSISGVENKSLYSAKGFFLFILLGKFKSLCFQGYVFLGDVRRVFLEQDDMDAELSSKFTS